MSISEEARMLHMPSRADEAVNLEQHINAAASLSRALWEILHADDVNGEDPRTMDALRALASSVADHATAARFAFNRRAEQKGEQP